MFTCSHGALCNEHARKSGTRKQTPAQDLDTTLYNSTLLLLQSPPRHKMLSLNNCLFSIWVLKGSWLAVDYFGFDLTTPNLPLFCASVLNPLWKERLRNKIALDILVSQSYCELHFSNMHIQSSILFGLSYTVIRKHTDYKFSRLLKLPNLDLFTSTISLDTCTNQEYKMHTLCVLWTVCSGSVTPE